MINNRTDHNLLIEQDSRLAHYQIFLISLLKGSLKLTIIVSIIIRNVKFAGLNTKILSDLKQIIETNIQTNIFVSIGTKKTN